MAADLVRHFSGRGYRGKAMFIAIDKATAIRMYDKVKRHWDEMLAREAQRVTGIADAVERRRRARSRTSFALSRPSDHDRLGPHETYAAETATRAPAATAPRRFTSPIAFAQTLHGLARRISPGADIGVRPKPMAMAQPSGQ